MPSNTEKTRALNDELRRHLLGGVAVMTPGIASLGPDSVNRIIKAVTNFNGFNPDNDPFGEHDFGTLEAEGHSIMFKIDYFDKRMQLCSPDPSDPTVTERVLTIMLAHEY